METKPLSNYERYRDLYKESFKKRFETNPEYREKHKQQTRERHKTRYHTDPEYRERKKQQALERYYLKKAVLTSEIS